MSWGGCGRWSCCMGRGYWVGGGGGGGWGGCGRWSCCMGRGYWVGWGRVGGWGWEERAVVLRTMPTLATIKLSRRWGTRDALPCRRDLWRGRRNAGFFAALR